MLALVLAGCASGPEGPGTAPGAAAGTASGGAEGEPARATNGLGLSRERLVEVLSEEDLDAAAFESAALDDGREVMTASWPAVSQRQVLWIGMFGGESAPHTVRLDYFPGNVRAGESEAVRHALDRLLVAIFPDWPEAPDWPEFAGARAWQETAKLMEGQQDQPTQQQQVPVLETERDGMWLAALGVPPDIVSYVITSQTSCRPSQASGFYEGFAACR